MKAKLIISISNAVVVAVLTFFANDLVARRPDDAPVQGAAQQPRVVRQQRGRSPRPIRGAAPQVQTTPQTGTITTTGAISAEKWKNYQAGLKKKFRELTPSKMLEIINVIEQQPLTEEQTSWLEEFKDKVLLYQKLQSQQSQIVPLMQLQQEQAGVVVPKKSEQSGWLGNLWDYESSLAKYMPTTALGGAAAGLAAYFALPAVVGYLSWGLAAKLGLMAAGADRIFYAFNQGALTESGAVDALKELIKNELEDEGRYPTLASKAEALSGNEFPGIKGKDPRIVALTLQALRTEITQTMKSLKENPGRQNELAQENMIVALVDQLRQQFGFTENRNAEAYVERLEHPKEFIEANMTDANAVAMIRAICSELLRMKAIVAIMKGEAEAKKQPLLTETKVEEVLGGGTYQNPLTKKAREWWDWMTITPSTEPVAK